MEICKHFLKFPVTNRFATIVSVTAAPVVLRMFRVFLCIRLTVVAFALKVMTLLLQCHVTKLPLISFVALSLIQNDVICKISVKRAIVVVDSKNLMILKCQWHKALLNT